MKFIAVMACALGIASLAVAPLLVAPADASETQHARPAKRYVKKERPRESSTQPRPGSDYKEQIADKLPFGSSAWWEQMQREGRLGGDTP
jgi:hypothetical protein